MSPVCFVNGRWAAASEATIGLFDGGFLHGAGLFETMRCEQGVVFRLDAHLRRLKKSIGLLLPQMERDECPGREVFRELLKRCHLLDARIRLTMTAGNMQADANSSPIAPTVCVTASELGAYPDSYYDKGVAVSLCNYRVSPSDPLAGHKTTSYLPRILGLRQAQAARCFEALWFTTEHYLAEGCISNVFIVSRGTIRTPPLNTPVLPGVARSVVLEIARSKGIHAEETPLTIDDLLDAEEVFLTNVMMLVLPVIRVEQGEIGQGRVGPMARELIEAFRATVRRECAPG